MSARNRLVLTGALVVSVVGAGGSLMWRSQFGADSPAASRSASKPTLPPDLLTSDASQLRDLSPADAIASNAEIPLAKGAVEPANALSLAKASSTDWSRSLECLTEAIYYEAALEPEEGQRAVAQVVLNRVRHPSYPKTICGVVYQGHERTTGCQFTFTCDGSLARRPVARIWDRARQIAALALMGSVYDPVGWATNYHANYVLPYWADSLLKTATVGRHIFYRLPGGGGSGRTFIALYSGNEPNISGFGQEALAAVEPMNTGEPILATLAERPVIENGVKSFALSSTETARPALPNGSARWVIGSGGGSASSSVAAAAPASRIVPIGAVDPAAGARND